MGVGNFNIQLGNVFLWSASWIKPNLFLYELLQQTTPQALVGGIAKQWHVIEARVWEYIFGVSLMTHDFSCLSMTFML